MGKQSKILKSNLRLAIREHGGNIRQVAHHFGVVRQTVYNLIDKYELRPEVEKYRRMMFRMAEDNILGLVEMGDFDASKLVVTSFPGGPRWSSKQDIALNAVTLSDETLRALEEMGVAPDDVAAEFEALIQAMAVANAD